MGVEIIGGDAERIKYKVEQLFAGFSEELTMAGEVAAEGIVRTTLAGIGKGDAPFAPYSPAYKALIDSVGGKPQGTVNLRGLFYPDDKGPRGLGTKDPELRKKRELALIKRGALRRAYVRIGFNARTRRFAAAGATGVRVGFTGRTKLTRPQVGVRDTLSEMSVDLIKVEATDTELTLTYTPRKEPYMITHNTGDGKMPKREWFSVDKAAVWSAMMKVIRTGLEARALWFNRPGA